MNIIFSMPAQLFMFVFILSRLFAFKYLVANSVIFKFIFTSFVFSDIIMILAFAWLIVNISVNSKSILNLDNKVLNFLGEISYGIYMYHMIVIFAIILILKNTLNQYSDLMSSTMFYVILIPAVILISYLSKRLFEDQFLKLKSKFGQ